MWHCCCVSLHFVQGFLGSSAALQLGRLETLQSTLAGGAGGSLGPQGGSSMSQPSSLLCWEKAGAACRVGVGRGHSSCTMLLERMHVQLWWEAPTGWWAAGFPPEWDGAAVCVCMGHSVGSPQADPAVLTSHTAVQRKHRWLLPLFSLSSPHWRWFSHVKYLF